MVRSGLHRGDCYALLCTANLADAALIVELVNNAAALIDELRQLRADRAELLAALGVCEAWERSPLPAPPDSGQNFVGLQPFYEALARWRALRTSNSAPDVVAPPRPQKD